MKHALIIGMGKSGQAAYAFLHSKGFQVQGVDDSPSLVKSLQEKGFIVSDDASLEGIDLVVVSPGVPLKHPLYKQAVERGLEIIGEAELGFRFHQQRAVAITGTNGKTTVTLLVEHILNLSGKKARALGNVGHPLTTYFLEPDPEEILVVELSSYQLETFNLPVFEAGVILNITPDHLDRYGNMQEYAAAKCRLQHCLTPKGVLYVNTQVLKEFSSLLKKPYVTYGSEPEAFFWTDRDVFKRGKYVEAVLSQDYRTRGLHESENLLAAWLICRHFGVGVAEFLDFASSFQKPAHRIEFVAEIDGVLYYDDSKGTNIDATIQAVRAMPGPVVLIAGGVDKGASYAPWKEFLQGKIKTILAIGEAAEKIAQEMQGSFPVFIMGSLQEAVNAAKMAAKSRDVVLLSPGCSSFDMFRDYAHRGEEFKRYISYLGEKA